MRQPLILASRSPRRRHLLQEAGIPFSCLDLDVDETLDESLPPAIYAEILAERKARAGAARCLQGRVLGADTVVAVGGTILGKPRDRDDARRMLRLLSGTTHEVITGVCLVDAPNGAADARHATTRITMRAMTEDEIAAYVASGESDDKAGAYAIQENGDRFVERVEGSYSNVVGLPMELLQTMLGSAS